MTIETAYYEGADSTETLDLYELLLENGVMVDFWFPKGNYILDSLADFCII